MVYGPKVKSKSGNLSRGGRKVNQLPVGADAVMVWDVSK